VSTETISIGDYDMDEATQQPRCYEIIDQIEKEILAVRSILKPLLIPPPPQEKSEEKLEAPLVLKLENVLDQLMQLRKEIKF